MIYEASPMAVAVFALFVAVTLGISFYMGRKAKSSAGYFAAHGQIPWFVNGVAFAGDYLSAASFLGICGMIAFTGYDGFLYSIGFLAGWIVALFVVAEPMKRLGKYTFADALDARFGSRAIKISAGISTLVVSVFYLIPQMVGAGALVTPLLGLPHWAGVVIVGTVVVMIVVTAGMVSTTWVQFLKGGLLIIFSMVLVVMILQRGFEVKKGGIDGHEFAEGEVQTLTLTADGRTLVNGELKGTKKGEPELHPIGWVSKLPDGQTKTGPVGPVEFFSILQQSEIVLSDSKTVVADDGSTTTTFTQKPTPGSQVLRPGNRFTGIREDDFVGKLNFLSLMLALFCGTASLPHILIRYYTVKDEAAARKSTIVGIATIGLFYVLTLYLGLGAMTSGAMDPTDTNMAAPLLARSINEPLFAIISAIAFTTVLGTVSGLILASAGAITHDLVSFMVDEELTEQQQVRVAKISSVVIGAIAIALGILFKGMNVGFLVGWAFSIAASANLPALVMTLFWKRVTATGISVAVVVGMVSSLAWILLSADSFEKIYGLPATDALVPFSQPGIVTIPLGFLVVVVVSLMTQPATETTNQ